MKKQFVFYFCFLLTISLSGCVPVIIGAVGGGIGGAMGAEEGAAEYNRIVTIKQEMGLSFNRYYGRAINQGYRITEVKKDSVAEKAGLKEGDIIIEWNNETLATDAKLSVYLYNVATKAEKSVTLKVERDNQISVITISM